MQDFPFKYNFPKFKSWSRFGTKSNFSNDSHFKTIINLKQNPEYKQKKVMSDQIHKYGSFLGKALARKKNFIKECYIFRVKYVKE